MKAIIINNKIKFYPSIPSTWVNVLSKYETLIDRHYQDGWRDRVIPSFDSETQKIVGDWIMKTVDEVEICTKEVEDLTQEEIEDKIEANIPSQLTASQLRQAMILQGISVSDVVGAINTLPSPEKELVLVKWEYETSFNRTSAEVQSIGQILQLNTEQINNLFIVGENL